MGDGDQAVTTNDFPQWDHELLFKILDTIHDVVLVINSESTIIYANDAYAKILGVPVAKVLGKRLDQIQPDSTVFDVLRTGQPNQGRQSYLSSVGVHVIGSTFPISIDEKVIGCISVFKNVTDVVLLNRELEQTKGVADYLKEQLDQWEKLPLSFKEYVGQNSRLKATLVLSSKVACTNTTVLILGESGVGKEVLARAIHNASFRKDKPMIKVNCAAIPEDLIESELFGYEDGAFTGAKKGGKLGKFELAHGGTIFLDEVGDMSLTMQAKLLRILQEKEFERVGGSKTFKVDIRVIAATNRNLEQMIEEGTFRQDLYYRLNIVSLYLSPLRERKDDILVLSQTFLNRFAKEVGREFVLSDSVEKFLQSYDWPGNIRELQNVLEHASIVCSGKTIDIQHLPSYLARKRTDPTEVKVMPHEVKDMVAKVEKELILSALAAHHNNRTLAMKELGISRKTFYDKLHRYGIGSEENEKIPSSKHR